MHLRHPRQTGQVLAMDAGEILGILRHMPFRSESRIQAAIVGSTP